MKIEMKLYATLMRYLPDGANDHTALLDVADGTTPSQVIDDMKLPRESCFLVLVNGIFLSPEERETRAMHEGDALAIWPPIAGG
jgi:sulfur carrier protein ThiS